MESTVWKYTLEGVMGFMVHEKNMKITMWICWQADVQDSIIHVYTFLRF